MPAQKTQNSIPGPGHNPTTGEWNDSLTGDFLWSSVNFGEAVPGIMTPITWSLLQRGALASWIEIQGVRSFGNIAGRMYLNISIFASLFHAMGRDRDEILESIEGTVHTSLPEGMDIPVIPTSRWSLLTMLPMLVRLQWKQRQDVRRLPDLLATNRAWCREMRERIDGADVGDELALLWSEAILPHLSKVWSAMLSSANHSAEYGHSLQRDLADLVGPEDAAALVSGLSSKQELLASLGPVAGVSKVAQGQMTRQAFFEEYGHRGEEEFELSRPRFGEDPAWLDQQLADRAAAPVDVEAL
ncbi:MAG TPA: pyruvate, phosphate dikinase, partial [Anaerolineae bacterium]|nr:pyruvate, phosphate dikinase [Anaerolineae bacterium]